MSDKIIDQISFKGRLKRLIWNITWVFVFKFTPFFLYEWRNSVLRLWGAKIGKKVHIYPSVKIWAPWNLEMEDNSCLGHNVNCYSVDKIFIAKNAVISQEVFLCSASHDIYDVNFKLVAKPIQIKSNVWIAASAFIGPGVIVGEGAVIGAAAVVFKNIPPWRVVIGNPARIIKKRKLKKISMN
jgi:putative colanic acid biosynthesis acetyltransferase WcaF